MCHQEHKETSDCLSCHDSGNISHQVEGKYAECMECHISGGHDPSIISFITITETQNDFCVNCHMPETQRINLNIHHLTDCVDCHPEHGEMNVRFDTCLCHGEVPSFHNGTTSDCYVCHDTTQVHSDPLAMAYSGIDMENEFCINCHTPEGELLSYNIHQYTDCTDCHSEHGLIRVEFDTCLCHDEIPSFHDETTASCEPCHDTTVIHTQP